MIKVWKIQLKIQKRDLFQPEKTTEKILVVLDCHMTFSNSDSGDPIAQKLLFAISENTTELCVPCNAGINLSDYNKGTQGSRLQERKETSRIISLISNQHNRLWGSAHDDCSVRIWDSKGVLIRFHCLKREIQFSGEISCIIFANKRGDLLIGLVDQISLIRIQDCKKL